jgi:hypothetical protein
MPDRISCCVPFCRRTCAGDPETHSWVCADHWRAVPVKLRRLKSRLFRKYRKKFGDADYWQFPAGSPKRIEAVSLGRRCDRAWQRCKRAAIEAAGGIG